MKHTASSATRVGVCIECMMRALVWDLISLGKARRLCLEIRKGISSAAGSLDGAGISAADSGTVGRAVRERDIAHHIVIGPEKAAARIVIGDVAINAVECSRAAPGNMKAVEAIVGRIVTANKTTAYEGDAIAVVVRSRASVHRAIRSQKKTCAGTDRVVCVAGRVIAGGTVGERTSIAGRDAAGAYPPADVKTGSAVGESASPAHANAVRVIVVGFAIGQNTADADGNAVARII